MPSRVSLRDRAKLLLSRAGGGGSFTLDALNWLFEYGAWVRKNGTTNVFVSREPLYDHVQMEVLLDGPVDYLEFGVFRGDSIRYWSTLNRHPESRFYGFDSFRGLPEAWNAFTSTVPKGTFDTGGELPAINDARVRFIEGYFQDSVPQFLDTFSCRNRLVLHLDADIYTATLYVLASLDRFIEPGTVLLFDEFASVVHEFKAFIEYSRSFQRSTRLLAVTNPPFYVQTAFEVVD